jgi:hypothetical protein
MSTERKQHWANTLSEEELDGLATKFKDEQDEEAEQRRKETIQRWWMEHYEKRKEDKEKAEAESKAWWAKVAEEEKQRQEAAKKHKRWTTAANWFVGSSFVAVGAFSIARGANHSPPAPPQWKNDWVADVVAGVVAVSGGILYAIYPS